MPATTTPGGVRYPGPQQFRRESRHKRSCHPGISRLEHRAADSVVLEEVVTASLLAGLIPASVDGHVRGVPDRVRDEAVAHAGPEDPRGAGARPARVTLDHVPHSLFARFSLEIIWLTAHHTTPHHRQVACGLPRCRRGGARAWSRRSAASRRSRRCGSSSCARLTTQRRRCEHAAREVVGKRFAFTVVAAVDHQPGRAVHRNLAAAQRHARRVAEDHTRAPRVQLRPQHALGV